MQNISTVSALKKLYFIFLIIIFFNGVLLFKVTVHLERCFQFFVCSFVNTHRLPTNLYINEKLMKLPR